MRKVFLFVVVALVICNFQVSAKRKEAPKSVTDTVLIQLESEIGGLAKKLYNTRRNDEESVQISEAMLALFKEAFQRPGAFDYPFDSCTSIGKITSEKNNVRLFTWNIVLNSGEYKYFGLIALNDNSKQKLYVLNDCSNAIVDAESASLTNENWYGANYYQMVERKIQNDTYYLLLGWHGENLHVNKKVIEVLYFTESGKPKFGKAIIKVDKKKHKRLIFEYASMVDMYLSYDSGYEMIVFDHLAVSSGIQAGGNEFYGPNFSYDALKFNGDLWEFQKTIDYKRLPEKKRRKNR